MRKLVLIAAMLLLPAMAFAQTVLPPPNSVQIELTGFEGFSLGGIHNQRSTLGQCWWGNWAGDVNIIADPTGAGHGQVVAWQPTNPLVGNNYRIFADFDQYPALGPDPRPVTATKGYFIREEDRYVASDGGDWKQNTFDEWGPINYYALAPSDRIEAWQAWGSPNIHYDLGPLPMDTWFTVKTVFDVAAGTVDMYVNGVLVGSSLNTFWNESNYLQYELQLLDVGYLTGGDTVMLLDNVNWTYSVPEPGIFALGALGLLPLLRRRKK